MGFLSTMNVATLDVASDVLRQQIVQDSIIFPGRSCNFEYVKDINKLQVDVAFARPLGQARRIGEGQTNTGWFNSKQNSTFESTFASVNLIDIFDEPIDVPKVMDEMTGLKALNGAIDSLARSITKAMNVSYLAQLVQYNIATSLTAAPNGSTFDYSFSDDYVVKMGGTNAQSALDALNAVAENLAKGDSTNGFDGFDVNFSALYLAPKFVRTMRSNATFFANNFIGQQMLAAGTFNAFDTEMSPSMRSGYMGDVLGYVAYQTYSLFSQLAGYLAQVNLSNSADFTAIPSTALDELEAIAVCGDAIFGAARVDGIEVLPNQKGQGDRVLPFARWGFNGFSPKAVQLIVSSTGLNGANFITGTNSSSAFAQTKRIAYLAPGSRA